MPTTTRATAHGQVDRLKTDLQIHRDEYGFKLRDKGWLPHTRNGESRANREPRGIDTFGGSNLCYQIVVHQSLLHTPVFLQWIIKHRHRHTPPNTVPMNECIKCCYRGLVEDYWLQYGETVEDAENGLRADNAHVERIAQIAAQSRPDAFPLLRPADASEFYEWLADQMFYQMPPNLTARALAQWKYTNWQAAHWNEEYEAIFQLDYEQEHTCLTCNTTQFINQSCTQIMLALSPNTTTLDEMIAAWFLDNNDIRQCTTCNAQTAHRSQKRIVAAPQVFRIQVTIQTLQGGRLLNVWDVPDQLRLQARQINMKLPLDYSLSTAIAHGAGPGQSRLDWLETIWPGGRNPMLPQREDGGHFPEDNERSGNDDNDNDLSEEEDEENEDGESEDIDNQGDDSQEGDNSLSDDFADTDEDLRSNSESAAPEVDKCSPVDTDEDDNLGEEEIDENPQEGNHPDDDWVMYYTPGIAHPGGYMIETVMGNDHGHQQDDYVVGAAGEGSLLENDIRDYDLEIEHENEDEYDYQDEAMGEDEYDYEPYDEDGQEDDAYGYNEEEDMIINSYPLYPGSSFVEHRFERRGRGDQEVHPRGVPEEDEEFDPENGYIRINNNDYVDDRMDEDRYERYQQYARNDRHLQAEENFADRFMRDANMINTEGLDQRIGNQNAYDEPLNDDNEVDYFEQVRRSINHPYSPGNDAEPTDVATLFSSPTVRAQTHARARQTRIQRTPFLRTPGPCRSGPPAAASSSTQRRTTGRLRGIVEVPPQEDLLDNDTKTGTYSDTPPTRGATRNGRGLNRLGSNASSSSPTNTTPQPPTTSTAAPTTASQNASLPLPPTIPFFERLLATHLNYTSQIAKQAEEDRNAGHYIANVRGPVGIYHVSDDHYEAIDHVRLGENPQVPGDHCARPPGEYQVVYLTYRREKLRGRAGVWERSLIPGFM